MCRFLAFVEEGGILANKLMPGGKMGVEGLHVLATLKSLPVCVFPLVENRTINQWGAATFTERTLSIFFFCGNFRVFGEKGGEAIVHVRQPKQQLFPKKSVGVRYHLRFSDQCSVTFIFICVCPCQTLVSDA